MAGPRYKPREAYQTRRASDEELEGAPDFAATTLDRPTASDADIRQAQLKQDVARGNRERAEAARRRRALVVAVALVVGLALAIGVGLGAYLAIR